MQQPGYFVRPAGARSADISILEKIPVVVLDVF